MRNRTNLDVLTRGIIRENPIFVTLLGICPTLAVTSTLTGALGMGLAAGATLFCSNTIISALRRVIPRGVRIPCYIVLIAAFVGSIQFLVHAFFPKVYDLLGVYLALITVNCIILSRAESFAGKNTVAYSALDGIGTGIGFTLALLAVAFVREIFGSGSVFGFALPILADHPVKLISLAPGGLLVFGLLTAMFRGGFINKGKKGGAS